MDPRLGTSWIVALLAPMAILMALAIIAEQRQRRRDRSDGVLVTWEDLRLTATDLIVGSGRDAHTIPLAGLKAVVEFTAAPAQSDERVHLTIATADHDIRRSQPYSYGASGGAQMFAIKLNALSDQMAPNQPGASGDGYPDIRAA